MFDDEMVYSPTKGSSSSRITIPFVSNKPSETEHAYKRIIDRDGEINQSTGKISLRKRIRGKDWRSLYFGDLFHSLVDAPTHRIIFIICVSYMLVTTLFAFPYLYTSRAYGCNLGITHFIQAFAFSLETMATIGYDTQDIFFGECYLPIGIIAAQICTKLIVDSVAIGIIYCRLSRPNSRASTIIFSNKSIIRRIRGKLYFMFQLCEFRKHQLSEVQIRLYLIRRDVDLYDHLKTDEETRRLKASSGLGYQSLDIEGGGLLSADTHYPNLLPTTPSVKATHFQTCSMRLLHPNDSVGSQLLLCLPQVIVHEIDPWSPLMPPPVWVAAEDGRQWSWSPACYRFAENIQRKPSTSLSAEEPLVHIQDTQMSPVLSGSRNRGPQDTSATLSNSFDRGRYDASVLSKISFPSASKRLCEESAASIDDGFGMKLFNSIMNKEQDVAIPRGDGLFGRDMNSPGEKSSGFIRSPASDRKRPRRPLEEEEDSRQKEEREMLNRYLLDRRVEIVAVVEGIDGTTGGVVQARYSYTIEDIEWNKTFRPCVFEDDSDASAVIDFSLFHILDKAPVDAPFSGSMASWI